MISGAIKNVEFERSEALNQLRKCQDGVLYWEARVGHLDRELYSLRRELKKAERKKKR